MSRFNRMRKTLKVRKTRRLGRGLTVSKIKTQSYPRLPESPTNRPEIKTNVESLLPVTPRHRYKRLAPIIKRIQQVQDRPPNSRSFFSVNNAGFKPNNHRKTNK